MQLCMVGCLTVVSACAMHETGAVLMVLPTFVTMFDQRQQGYLLLDMHHILSKVVAPHAVALRTGAGRQCCW
jgi:hypothetical protein